MTPLKIAALAVSAGALVATSAIAAQTSAPTSATDEKKAGSRMVCRNLTMSGTRLSSRHCRTQADWDNAERKTQDDTLRQRTAPAVIPDMSAPR